MSLLSKILTEEQILELASKCEGCTFCESRCPTGVNRRKMFTYIRMGEWEKAAKEAFLCTNCNVCEYSCPRTIPGFPVIEDVRSKIPSPQFLEIEKKIFTYGNPFALSPESKHMWMRDVKVNAAPSQAMIKEFGRVVLFPGCMLNYRDTASAISALSSLKKMGLEVELAEKEICCGSVLMRAGIFDEKIQEIARKNIEAVEETGADLLVTLCPTCDMVWKHDYRLLVGDFKLKTAHYSEVVKKALEKQLIEFKKPVEIKATYHDSCHLVTGPTRLVKEPREVLRRIPKLEVVEMIRKGVHTRCCGSMLRVKDSKKMLELSSKRAEQAQRTGAECLITTCPLCKKNLEEGIKNISARMKVSILPEIVEMAEPHAKVN